jgi:hypothetical protein
VCECVSVNGAYHAGGRLLAAAHRDDLARWVVLLSVFLVTECIKEVSP